MITEVRNLMWQQAHLFQRLEATKTMRAYIVHNMDGNEEILANLGTTMSEVVAARKLVEKSVSLLRKDKEENKEASQVEAHWLAEETATMDVEKEKVEEETIWLKRELQNL